MDKIMQLGGTIPIVDKAHPITGNSYSEAVKHIMSMSPKIMLRTIFKGELGYCDLILNTEMIKKKEINNILQEQSIVISNEMMIDL